MMQRGWQTGYRYSYKNENKLAFHDSTHYEPAMHENRCDDAVVMIQDAEAFFQRISMVLGGVAAYGKVGYYRASIDEWHFFPFGILHNSYAPVNICAVAVLQVVVYVLGNLTSGIECLMAYQHAVFERLPRQLAPGMQTAVSKECAIFICDVCVTIYYRYVRLRLGCLCYAADGVLFRKGVSGIQEHYEVAVCLA